MLTALLASLWAAEAAVIVVPDQMSNLRNALQNAQNGDEVWVRSGLYSDRFEFSNNQATLRAHPENTAPVRLTSASGTATTPILDVRSGAKLTVIGITFDGQNNMRRGVGVRGTSTELVTRDVTFRNLRGSALYVENGPRVTVENSLWEDGSETADGNGTFVELRGGILTVTGGTMTRGSATLGGAIYASGGTLIINGTTFLGNTAAREGGAIRAEGGGSVEIRNAVFRNNTAEEGGHLSLNNRPSVVIVDSVFEDGRALVARGGAIRVGSPNLVDISGSTFSRNVSRGNGGAFSAGSAGGLVRVTNSVFDANESQQGAGGGLSLGDGPSVELLNVDFINNSAAEQGGGLRLDNTPGGSVTNVSFSGNAAARGGGLFWFGNTSAARLEVNGAVFESNVANGVASPELGGGGMAARGPGLLVVDTGRFVDNQSTLFGGGLAATDGAGLQLRRSFFCENQVLGLANDANGGALGVLQPSGLGVVENNLFVRNRSVDDGGGVFFQAGSVTFRNNTLLGNVAGGTADGDGAAVAMRGTGGTFRDNLIAWNQAGNGAVQSVTGPYPTFGYNLWYTNTNADFRGSISYGVGEVRTQDPLLVRYAATTACDDVQAWLKSGSPAINAGDPARTDPDGSRADIGAYGGPGALVPPFVDQDGDGYTSATDCNDNNASVNPGATERCNGIDDDCDGAVDGASAVDANAFYLDGDGDGFGWSGTSQRACVQPSGFVTNAADCNDANAAVRPGAAESCNEVDDDCDGAVDEGVTLDAWPDVDGDSYGANSGKIAVCSVPSGYASRSGDCNDTDPQELPGQVWYADTDGDSFGDADARRVSCSRVIGHVLTATDCDDTDAAVFPGAAEVCNETDDDCDGQVDEHLVTLSWYLDGDRDGYGVGAAVVACRAPLGRVNRAGDCDDTKPELNPGAQEICNGADDDCDGLVDANDPSLDPTQLGKWYTDADTDGYGRPGSQVESCEPIPGRVGNAADCDDGNANVSPSAVEVCNGVDDDCDSRVDDTDPDLDATTAVSWYPDQDGDGFGAFTGRVLACAAPPGRVANRQDCDDSNANIRPGAVETPGDGIDQDCDGLDGVNCDVDGDGWEGAQCGGDDCEDRDLAVSPSTPETWYDGIDQNCDGNDADQDGDGASAIAAGGDDCDDTDPDVKPGAVDLPGDGIDQDCDGADATPPDRDGDGLSDADELAYGTNPDLADTDGDGLSDGAEVQVHGTDPLRVDTDRGCAADGAEVSAGADPLDPSDDDCDTGDTGDSGDSDDTSETDDSETDDASSVDTGTDTASGPPPLDLPPGWFCGHAPSGAAGWLSPALLLLWRRRRAG